VPDDGWALVAEISEPAEGPHTPDAEWVRRVTDDAVRIGALPADACIESALVWAVDPAYVVFRPGEHEIVRKVRDFFATYDVHVLGRYGRWEYSSMAQVIRDGFRLARSLAGLSPEASA
jgi:hypothetical protein